MFIEAPSRTPRVSLPVAQYNKGDSALSEILVRNADDGAILNGLTVEKCGLDLLRIDIDASRDDHVVEPISQEDVSVVVTEADIADVW